MKRYILSIVSLLMLAMGLLFLLQPESTVAKSKRLKRWTNTKPAINAAHIFHGEINRKGRPVGFHSRPEGKDPQSAKVVKRLNGPNKLGVYVARVAIRQPGTNKWLEKNSSIFPDKMTPKEVVAAVLHAYRKGKIDHRGKFRGPSGLGFTIEGWTLRDGRINTAYPIYRSQGRR